MGRSKARSAPGSTWIHSTRLHVVLYSFLLVFTPFILLQNFLIDFVSGISGRTVSLGGVHVPVVPLIAGVLLLAAALRFRARITKRMLAAAAIVILMDALAQRMSDYYFGQKFYDLLQNWHYIAYGLFAPMLYRDLEPRGMPLARILWITFFCALGFSVFDEFFQRYMSSRVFDLSDTAKDVWGCLMGMVVVSLCGRHGNEVVRGWKRARHAGPRESLNNPLVALVLMICFDLIFLSCASLLSDSTYAPQVALLSVGISLLVLAIYFALHYRRARIVLGAIVLAAVLALGYSVVRPHGGGIVHNRYGYTAYRGLPIPYFDVMIYPDGGFRLVDKKHSFTQRDQLTLLRHAGDIIVVGSGARGLGGQGFPETSMVQFLHNPYSGGVTQLIILKTPDACRTFNRLKQEGKSVLFVLHNSC